MFLTIGQGIFDGLVPYRDLWDGKGFAVFFVVGVFGKIFPGIYFGQWMLSCISVTLTGYFLYRAASCIVGEQKNAHAVAVLCLCLLLYQSRMYIVGGVSDEYIAPVMAFLLYRSVNILRGKLTSALGWVTAGIACALLFWMKFTICVAPFIVLVGHVLVSVKQGAIRVLLKQFAWLMLGVGLVSLPVIIYFAWNASLEHLFYGYYLFHKLYHPTSGIRGLASNLLSAVALHPLAFFVLGVGMMKLLYGGFGDRNKLILFLSGAGLLICVYMGSSIHYYFMAVLPYTVFGVCFLLEEKSALSRIARWMAAAVFLISSASLYPWKGEPGISYAEVKNQKGEIQAIASYCKEFEDNSIMYLGCMESGVYHVLGQYPTLLYYQQCNYDPVGAEAQREHINNKVCRFVLIRRTYNRRGEDVTEEESESYMLARSAGYVQVEQIFSEGKPVVMLLQRGGE